MLQRKYLVTHNVLRELRLSKCMTQSALAEEIGFSKSAISKYENGDRIPRVDTLEKLAIVLDADIWDLVDYFQKRKI